MNRDIFDLVVVGTGIAGLSAAIYSKEAGLNVLVLTKEDDVAETNTNYAQGGIIAWKDGDNSIKLEQDIMKAGCYYNRIEAVREFCKDGPNLVFDFLIKKVGIKFTQSQSGDLDYTEEAAHSERRILHYADHTGDTIQQALISYAKKIGIPILAGHTSIDLITNNHHSANRQELYNAREVMGVYVLDNNRKVVNTIFANKVILATGGVGNIYQHTTNPELATGDGMSMAYRAGADIINAEMIQFHPTALFHRDIKRFLISESLRGEGARLIDHDGNEFMHKYTPQRDLAPRDVVARSIYEEMNTSGKEYMFLDLASYYKGKEPIQSRFSKIYDTCLKGGIDITKEPIPIVPAAHYFCGGVKVDINGRTSLKNLYAIGETSCTGLHGANRLASSSLLEGLLWAKNASEDICKNLQPMQKSRLDAIPDWLPAANSEEFDPLLLQQDWGFIRLTMWNYAGIIRTQRGLERAKSDLNYYSHRIFKFYKTATLTKNMIELRNAVVNASIIVNAAIHNNKSIGCHFVKQ